jgi:hypothetical protein
MNERLFPQRTDAFEYEPEAIVAASLAPVTFGGRVALLAVPVYGRENTLSGVYRSRARAVADVLRLDAERRWNLYARLQPVSEAVRTTEEMLQGPTVRSENIAALRHLLIEIDAPHADREPPSADQVGLAHDVATLVWALLLRLDIPREALWALQSGHGVHIGVGVHLSGTAADLQLWADILGSIADAFSRHGLGGELIDRGVVSLTTSTRVAGTMNVKYTDDPAPVWLLRPWDGETVRLEILQQVARRGRSIREHAQTARAAQQRKPGKFPEHYRPAWVRELLTHGAPEGSRHTECRRLIGWFITYAPGEAERALDQFVSASRWDGSEARAVLRHYQRRHAA